MGEIRVGKVSSVNYETGMVKVTYPDRNGEVTRELPCYNNHNEYDMLDVNESVLVLHLSNGSSRGVVIGGMWNKGNLPTEAKKGLYRKELSKVKDKSFLRYDDDTGEFIIKADKIILQDKNYKISLTEFMNRIEAIEKHIVAE